MSINLTAGGIQQLMRTPSGRPQSGANIILQLIKLIPLNNIPEGRPKYKVQISDGQMTHQAVLGTGLDPLVHDGKLRQFSIFKVDRFISTNHGNVQLLIIVDLDVLDNSLNHVIGNPSDMRGPQQVATPQQQSNQHQHQQPSNQHQHQQRMMGHPPLQQSNQHQMGYQNMHEQHSSNQDDISQREICPIEYLNEYQRNWTLKARVSKLGAVKNWSKGEKSGKLCSIDLFDESGEIRATMFNEVVDRIIGQLELNKVYYFSGGSIKQANKQWNHLNHPCEITFNSRTIVQPAQSSSIPNVSVTEIIPLDQLPQVEDKSFVDVIGIITHIGEVETGNLEKQDNRPFTRREVKITDNSSNGRNTVNVTIWDVEAQQFSGHEDDIFLGKKLRKSSFNSVSLSSTKNASTVLINPEIQKAHELKKWWNMAGRNMPDNLLSTAQGGFSKSSKTLKPRRPISWIMEKNLGVDGSSTIFVRGYISFVSTNRYHYEACPTCNKKIHPQQDGQYYHCDNCRTDVPQPSLRYSLSFKISDDSGDQWVTAFDQAAKTILGVDCQDLVAFNQSEEDKQMAAGVFNNARFKEFTFRLRVRRSENSDSNTPRIQSTVSGVYPVHNSTECRAMMKTIDRFLDMQGQMPNQHQVQQQQQYDPHQNY